MSNECARCKLRLVVAQEAAASPVTRSGVGRVQNTCITAESALIRERAYLPQQVWHLLSQDHEKLLVNAQ